MIASAIAYILCAIMATVGAVALVQVMSNRLPDNKHLPTFIVSVLFFFAAWGCAYLGGI